jgi:uncharacterized protein (TIGR02231 family)
VVASIDLEPRCFPPRDSELAEVSLPIVTVTLLEDRAQVKRRGTVRAKNGRNRLVVLDVAPVLQDVSLQGSVVAGSATIADVRARRAMRILSAAKPEAIRALDKELEGLGNRFHELAEERARAEGRREQILGILEKCVREVPEDVAWGSTNHQAWRDNFETLFKRSRELKKRSLEHHFAQRDLIEEIDNASLRRMNADRPDARLVAWVEIDLLTNEDQDVEIGLEYVVPNAIWRPIHSARLSKDSRLRFVSSAAVWQNTGEDWDGVDLVFSTARSSLGTEPPLLSDDLLVARRRSEQVEVSLREVAIQRTGRERVDMETQSMDRSMDRVDLPGVDDGGDTQALKARGKSRVPSDGRPNIIPIMEFETEADSSLILIPELDPKVFLRSAQKNDGAMPILAGPVELLRDNGFVGWTQVLYVAPKDRFELSFGPDDSIRVARKVQDAREPNPIDKWSMTVSLVSVYISNLSVEPKRITLKERIPVSEIEHARVTLIGDKTSGAPEVDDDGIVTWKIELPGEDHKKIRLAWSLALSPDVALES